MAVPVDLAWHPLQILLALDADDAFALAELRQRLDKGDLRLAQFVDDTLRVTLTCCDLTAPLHE
jgi:hypothetical protein